jgi:hypothetical protein
MPVLMLFTMSLVAMLIGLSVGVFFNRRALERRVDAEVAQLFAEIDTLPTYYGERELEGLPAPVARFMRRNLEEGQPHLSCLRMRQAGNVRERPGQPWTEFEAEQYLLGSEPALLWYATLRPFPLLWIDQRELLLQGRAHVLGKIASTLTTIDRSDDATRRALLLRTMVERVLLPSALLPGEGEVLQWTAIDDERAELRMRSGELEVRGTFVFNQEGDVLRFETRDRPWLGEGEVGDVQWVVEFGEHRIFGQLHIPTTQSFRWLLDNQPFVHMETKLEVFELDVARRFGTAPARRQD